MHDFGNWRQSRVQYRANYQVPCSRFDSKTDREVFGEGNAGGIGRSKHLVSLFEPHCGIATHAAELFAGVLKVHSRNIL